MVATMGCCAGVHCLPWPRSGSLALAMPSRIGCGQGNNSASAKAAWIAAATRSQIIWGASRLCQVEGRCIANHAAASDGGHPAHSVLQAGAVLAIDFSHSSANPKLRLVNEIRHSEHTCYGRQIRARNDPCRPNKLLNCLSNKINGLYLSSIL